MIDPKFISVRELCKFCSTNVVCDICPYDELCSDFLEALNCKMHIPNDIQNIGILLEENGLSLDMDVENCVYYLNHSSQEAKTDNGKLQLMLVPTQIIRDISEVRMYGNKKYGDSENWKQVDILRYKNALMRHLLAYIDDPDGVDEESGIPHYKHMACNMAFICAMEKEKRERREKENGTDNNRESFA